MLGSLFGSVRFDIWYGWKDLEVEQMSFESAISTKGMARTQEPIVGLLERQYETELNAFSGHRLELALVQWNHPNTDKLHWSAIRIGRFLMRRFSGYRLGGTYACLLAAGYWSRIPKGDPGSIYGLGGPMRCVHGKLDYVAFPSVRRFSEHNPSLYVTTSHMGYYTTRSKFVLVKPQA